MIAAIQPFISGAISKTFNMSAETTVDEIMQAYMMGWKLGLKAFAVYRDGSKAAQPLTTFGDKKKEKEKPQPVRRHLPLTRASETHKFSIAGHEGFLTYSAYDDGTLAEIFIRMSKQGSTLAGLLDALAISVSIALQYGVPLKTMARRFSYSRFEPSGYTENPAIQVATSITDYIFRYLGLRFLSESDLEELGVHAPTKELVSPETHHPVEVVQIRETSKATETVTEVKRVVYADTVCRACGGMLIRTGTCKTCIQCGTSDGGC
jgi:ribonucleoside-diphosphate reductase alpha chain